MSSFQTFRRVFGFDIGMPAIFIAVADGSDCCNCFLVDAFAYVEYFGHRNAPVVSCASPRGVCGSRRFRGAAHAVSPIPFNPFFCELRYFLPRSCRPDRYPDRGEPAVDSSAPMAKRTSLGPTLPEEQAGAGGDCKTFQIHLDYLRFAFPARGGEAGGVR